MAVLRVESGLFFANADHVRDAIKEHTGEGEVRALVLDAQTMPFVDVTAAGMLDDLRTDLTSQGLSLLLARDVGQVRDVIRRSRPEVATGEDGVFATVEEAVEAASLATERREKESR